MPVLFIHESEGRTAEQRRVLVRALTDAFERAYGLPPEAVTIFFQAYGDQAWGKEGLLHADRRPGG